MKSADITKFILLLSFAGFVFSCTRASNPDIERGSSYHFQDGYPEVRISALGYLNEEDEGVINIAADIVEASLIYREREGVNRADIELEIRITGVENTTYSDTYNTSMRVESDQTGVVTNQNLISFERNMDVPPGDYEVFVSVIDQASGNRTTRSTRTYIPDPSDDVVNLTAIQMLGRSTDDPDSDYQPITTYDVSTAKDSIRFVLQVTNNRSDNPLTIHSQFKKFESDTSAARPMSFNNYSPSSMPYKGIEYNRSEVLEETRRVLEQPGSVLIEYRYTLPGRGNYRFEVRTEGAGSEELYKARDFSVKTENYPAIKSPRELAGPLAYLMGRNDYEDLMEIRDPDTLKEAVDRFWLENVGSMNRARNVISLYYERVEQANKQFSNFKEGWKTDPGMIYILFGPPWYVERRLNRMQWSYSYDRTDPRYNFYFEKPKMRNEFFPFDNYLLQRSQNYFNIQYQQVQLWLSGEILNTNI
jgi:GWxTD domain-containing protein